MQYVHLPCSLTKRLNKVNRNVPRLGLGGRDWIRTTRGSVRVRGVRTKVPPSGKSGRWAAHAHHYSATRVPPNNNQWPCCSLSRPPTAKIGWCGPSPSGLGLMWWVAAVGCWEPRGRYKGNMWAPSLGPQAYGGPGGSKGQGAENRSTTSDL